MKRSPLRASLATSSISYTCITYREYLVLGTLAFFSNALLKRGVHGD